MDRFIEYMRNTHCESHVNLKSNMDRFIAKTALFLLLLIPHLKSNMDRFIENIAEYQSMFAKYLKSNMDRFIELSQIPKSL